MWPKSRSFEGQPWGRVLWPLNRSWEFQAGNSHLGDHRDPERQGQRTRRSHHSPNSQNYCPQQLLDTHLVGGVHQMDQAQRREMCFS